MTELLNSFLAEDEHRKELMRRFSTQPSVDEAQSDVMSEKSSRRRRRRSTRATSVRSDRSEETKVSKRKSMKREEPIELIKKEAEGEGNV